MQILDIYFPAHVYKCPGATYLLNTGKLLQLHHIRVQSLSWKVITSQQYCPALQRRIAIHHVERLALQVNYKAAAIVQVNNNSLLHLGFGA